MKKVILFSSLCLLLSACNNDSKGGTAAVDNSGLCKDSTISAYNSIVTKARSMSSVSITLSDYRDLNTKCETYKSLVAGQSCKALIGGTETMVDSTSLDAVCDLAKKALGI